jgi:hypothetical protein
MAVLWWKPNLHFFGLFSYLHHLSFPTDYQRHASQPLSVERHSRYDIALRMLDHMLSLYSALQQWSAQGEVHVTKGVSWPSLNPIRRRRPFSLYRRPSYQQQRSSYVECSHSIVAYLVELGTVYFRSRRHKNRAVGLGLG